MKIDKWTRRYTNAEVGPERPEVVSDSGDGEAIHQPPDGLSEAGVREALRDVRDPEIGRDLVSLNMIRNIEIKGSLLTVGVALTTAGCPLKHRITTDITD
ncbi:MAG TPA: iron-sulfur cluster assembly protein, partial [Rubrobacter sp.]|nr:iron-sulfur cluster assembly protein [Rubrobacter sp.]